MAVAAATIQHGAEQLAARLPPLLVEAERVASTVAQGVHGRRRVGTGETFWQFRQYQLGDAPQRIDWRETAKGQRVYIRETEWEAAQSVWLWRDASPSMNWSSSKQLPVKRARADLLLVALAARLVRGGERVTLLGSDIPPSSGRVVIERLAQIIDRAEATGSLPEFEMLPRWSNVVLLGDLLSTVEEVRQTVSRFTARGVRGHLLQVLDPAEEDLPYDGRIRFEGIESADEILISRVETVRDDYATRLAAHREALAGIARGYGWTFLTHRTDRPPHLALLALYSALARTPG